MAKFLSPFFSLVAGVACALSLSACSPRLDWREVHGAGVPFSVLLPAKPASSSRQVNLEGLPVSMTMTAADATHVVFAVGATELPDHATAMRALGAMKTALVKNIGGSIRRETASSAGTTVDIEAAGRPGNGDDQPRLLVARFIVVDKRVYQLAVVGKEQAVSREAVDTFLTSFKPG